MWYIIFVYFVYCIFVICCNFYACICSICSKWPSERTKQIGKWLYVIGNRGTKNPYGSTPKRFYIHERTDASSSSGCTDAPSTPQRSQVHPSQGAEGSRRQGWRRCQGRGRRCSTKRGVARVAAAQTTGLLGAQDRNDMVVLYFATCCARQPCDFACFWSKYLGPSCRTYRVTSKRSCMKENCFCRV